jgi:hypothetical protein
MLLVTKIELTVFAVILVYIGYLLFSFNVFKKKN